MAPFDFFRVSPSSKPLFLALTVVFRQDHTDNFEYNP